MIRYSQARQLIQENLFLLKPTVLSLAAVNGLVLTEPAIARFDIPRFDNSAKDGYGVKLSDLQTASSTAPVALHLQATIAAGHFYAEPLKAGHTVRIMTGAPVPPGVDAIVMKEECSLKDKDTVLFQAMPEFGEHIRKRGDEFSEDDVILDSGTVISPPIVGLLASLGYDRVQVYPSPRVAVLLTGDELVQPGQALPNGKIYEANSHALRAALQQAGISHCTIRFVKDDYPEVKTSLQALIADHDVVLTVGGISAGDYDFVKTVLDELNVRQLFWKVAIKPGMPFYFGKTMPDRQDSHSTLIFGLPGNPVSALVTFHQLVLPALNALRGLSHRPETLLKARLSRGIEKQAGRLTWVRAVQSRQHDMLFVSPASGQDSHMLGGLAKADCLIHFPESAEAIRAEDTVLIQPLTWGAR